MSVFAALLLFLLYFPCVLHYYLSLRCRLVNSLLSEELKEIHAFSQKPLTPQQWEDRKAQQQ